MRRGRIPDSITQMRRIIGAVVVGVVSFAPPASADLIGDRDCWSLAVSCPDGSLWRDGLGGVFSADYRSPGDLATASFTDIWDDAASIAYTHAGVPGDSLVLRIAGIANDFGPWDVYGDGVLLGQLTTNVGPDNFQEVLTYTFPVPLALLADNLLDVLLDINNPIVVDGYAIDYSELGAAAAVPEPSPLTLLSLGLLWLLVIRRKRLV